MSELFTWQSLGTLAGASIAVVLSAPSGVTATVDYASSDGTATAGSDYTAVVGTLTFAPGATSARFTVPISDDLWYDPDETITLTLGSPISAARQSDPAAKTNSRSARRNTNGRTARARG